MYICVKLPLGDLNPDPCPPHPTSTYTCGVTTAPRVRDGNIIPNFESLERTFLPVKFVGWFDVLLFEDTRIQIIFAQHIFM